MDIFDQYLFEELVSEYERSGLTNDDYEELYIRFSNLNHLEEVKPYLLVMRYLGLGTPAEPDAALNELKEIMEDNIELTGLYNDLKLCTNSKNTGAIVELRRSIEDGYCGKYLKSRSNISSVEKTSKEEKKPSTPAVDNTVVDDTVHYKYMRFEGCGYSGLFFTSGDIDYLNAKIFIEPMKATRKISIRSQIFAGDDAFSKVFSDEITLKPGDTWFTTTGWGNKNYNCYGNRTYQWRVEIDGADVYCQDFRFYTGTIDKYGIPVKNVVLFASKASGAVEKDWNNYSTTFDSNTLEYVYFKLLFNQQGQEKNFQVHIKVDNLENGTEFYNGTSLFHIESNWDNSWTGVGLNNGKKWDKGLYKYTLRIGSGSTFEGNFTVY